MNHGAVFFDVAAIAYIAAFFGQLIAYTLKRPWIQWLGRTLLVAAFLAQTIGLVLRGIALGGFPVTNTYESLIFYGWVFAFSFILLCLADVLRDRLRDSVGIGVGLLAALALGVAGSPLRNPELAPLVPALRSHWLALHVSLVFLGEGFFTVAFVGGVIYLLAERRRRSPRPDLLQRLDALIYRAIAIGFPFFTLGGLFFGAIWAKHAWGRYWGWDPKETFMLMTWLVYVLFLHVRMQRGWHGRRTAWIAVLGFLLALFTFAGVNYLIRGLHSYV